MQEYINSGVPLGWLISREHKKVEIYRNGQPVEVLDAPKELSGEDILPGFIRNIEVYW